MTDAPDTRMSLLRRVSDPRDDGAWREFAGIYEPLIYRLARRSGLQDADAREVTQSVLIAVAGAIDGWTPAHGAGSFRAWLARIARNAGVNFLIAQKRRPRGSGDSNVMELLGRTPATAPEEAAVFEEEYRRQVFRRAAERVRPAFHEKTWSAFWRTCVDGEAIKSVAADLNLGVGSVYAARSRVVARVTEEARALLQEEELET